MGRSFVNQSMGFAELEAQMTSERIRAVSIIKYEKVKLLVEKFPLATKSKTNILFQMKKLK